MTRPIVLWKQPDGSLTNESPGEVVASSFSIMALKKLARTRAVFVLSYDTQSETIKVERVEPATEVRL